MKQISLFVCFSMFILLGLSHAYAQDNKGYIQGVASATPDENQSAAQAVIQSQSSINATDMGYENTPLNKLSRGLLNIFTFYLEIPAKANQVSKERDNAFIGATVGSFEGIFTALFRGLTGICDTVTFVFPPYNKPIMEPEYAIDSLKASED